LLNYILVCVFHIHWQKQCREDGLDEFNSSAHQCLLRSHAIVSSLVGPEYYVNVMSFVDKGQLEPGCSILLHNKVRVSNNLISKIFSPNCQSSCQ
jgi:ATP-dependent 26S proteasome regulatory subunit